MQTIVSSANISFPTFLVVLVADVKIIYGTRICATSVFLQTFAIAFGFIFWNPSVRGAYFATMISRGWGTAGLGAGRGGGTLRQRSVQRIRLKREK